jgi:hypothetical protein
MLNLIIIIIIIIVIIIIGVPWGGHGGVLPLQSFLPKNKFLAAQLKRGQLNWGMSGGKGVYVY